MRQAFEWDEEKAKASLRKHRISFGEAATVFHDPFIASMLDPDHSGGELRFIAIGRSAKRRLLVVVYVERGSSIRIISCRKATSAERGAMKKTTIEQGANPDAEMRAEYDFRGAQRGTAYRPLHEGYEVQIHRADGTTLVQQFVLQEGTVMLEPDVQAFFPDSESVNKALRTLMTLFPTSRKSVSRTAQASGSARKLAAKNHSSTESRNA